MDRPSALVGWYYLPIAVIYATAMATLTVPLAGALAILVMAIVTSALTRAYRAVTDRRPAGSFASRRERPWSIVVVVVLVGAVAANAILSIRLHAYWPGWIAGALVFVVILVAGAIYESRTRRMPAHAA